MIKWPWGKKSGHAPTRSEKNELVRVQLRKHGDDGKKARHVIHFAYPVEGSNAQPKADVKLSLSDLDVRFTETDDSDGIVFEHEREVASAGFDDLTADLLERFSKAGWHYDGWECAVETGD
ncbi:ribonuclease E inhibitor RraB [Anderseniella sp. Alg231-50]|uniref:ribonuclease E inhibitor RraB n=1 Tax=Anderseniella sp. Alg231-50 TaxID=1922226 RepID=UPI000D55F865